MKLVSLDKHPEWRSVFADLPNRILTERDTPYALKSDYVTKILDLKFPVPSEAFFFEDPTGEFFGRILLQGSSLDKTMGHFGMFCLSQEPKHQDMFLKLWPEIESWFKDYGITKIVGPYLFTTFFPYRFRSDKNPERFAWEPNQPGSDLEIFQKLGFGTHETYFSSVVENFGNFATKGTKELDEYLKLGFKMRPITKETIDQDVKIIYELSMNSFTDNYLFAPIPFELFKSVYVPSFQTIDLRLSCIQETPDGKAIGYNFTFVMDNQIVIKSVSTAPEYRGKGLLNAGIRYSIIKARELYPNATSVCAALMHEQNAASTHTASQNTNVTRHEYVLLSKDI